MKLIRDSAIGEPRAVGGSLKKAFGCMCAQDCNNKAVFCGLQFIRQETDCVAESAP